MQAQQRLMLNADVYVTMSNSANITLANSNPNAITSSGGANLISESEYNVLKWNIGTNTGTYTIPFTKSAGNKIPFTLNITGAGVGAGTIKFSTYGGSNWDNLTYKPSDVTTMGGGGGTIANNSANVIDRFWIIEASGYSNKPSATFNLTYLDAEWSLAGNTITEGAMGAQRFDNALNTWDPYMPQGTINTAANTVSAIPVTSTDFFRSWTLGTTLSPLPIELVSFDGFCDAGVVTLNWSTATEHRNSFFCIEKTKDAITWLSLDTILGGGNSASLKNYSYSDDTPYPSIAYYRLKQTDFNGTYKYYKSIYVLPCANNQMDVLIYPNPVDKDVTIETDSPNNTLAVYNALGVLVYQKNSNTSTTKLLTGDWVPGIYYLTIQSQTQQRVTKKIIKHQ